MTSLPPRIDGDRLVSWIRMVVQEETLLQNKQQLAIQILESLGYTPGEYLLSDDGYIVTEQEVLARQRIRTVPTLSGDAHPAPQNGRRQTPDSATPEPGHHTIELPGHSHP